MPGKLDIYNLGDQGVSLVPSPVHAPDGSYLAAQNAHANVQGAAHGLSKRPGLERLTTTAAVSGAILAFSAIPFAEPVLTKRWLDGQWIPDLALDGAITHWYDGDAAARVTW